LGRPTALTPELVNAIVAQVQWGVPPSVAANAMGVGTSTYYEWIARGEGHDANRPMTPLYADFAERVADAEAQSESALVTMAIQKVRTTADAVLLLERRWPARWKRTEEVTINIRREAEKIARETGLNADDILREAEAILGAS